MKYSIMLCLDDAFQKKMMELKNILEKNGGG